MPGAIDPSIREALIARLRFYRDLGVTEFYRRPVDPALLSTVETSDLDAPGLASETWVGSPYPTALIHHQKNIQNKEKHENVPGK